MNHKEERRRIEMNGSEQTSSTSDSTWPDLWFSPHRHAGLASRQRAGGESDENQQSERRLLERRRRQLAAIWRMSHPAQGSWERRMAARNAASVNREGAGGSDGGGDCVKMRGQMPKDEVDSVSEII